MQFGIDVFNVIADTIDRYVDCLRHFLVGKAID